MKGGSFMANTEIFLRNIFGTTRPNIRPLVLALNITNDLLFEQHISMSDIKATKHIYPDVARLLHKKPETVYKSVIRLAHRCWDALVEQDLVLSYLGRSMKQEPDPSVFITVADGLFCREIDGLFCRSSPDIIVRRRCVLSHKRRGWLQPSPSFRYSRNLALQDELYHPVINNGPAVLVCVDKRLGTGPVNQSRDAG